MVIYTQNEFPADLKAIADANKTALTELIRRNFEVAITSDVIMSSQERIERLVDACKIPVSDDLAYNRVYANAQKDLEGEAAREAFKKNEVPVLPTIEQIHELALKRYNENAAKVQAKEQAKAEKEAKNQKVAS